MDVIVALAQCIAQCFGWFTELMTKFGTLPLWMGVFTLWTIYRFILSPILGATISAEASEYVKNQKKKNR